MKKFATLTIGQAPRPDLAPVFNAITPAGTEVVHAGCLDGLTKAEVDKQFAPVGSEGLLTSRMLDGTAVVLGKSAVRKALQEKIHQLEKAGCSPSCSLRSSRSAMMVITTSLSCIAEV